MHQFAIYTRREVRHSASASLASRHQHQHTTSYFPITKYPPKSHLVILHTLVRLVNCAAVVALRILKLTETQNLAGGGSDIGDIGDTGDTGDWGDTSWFSSHVRTSADTSAVTSTNLQLTQQRQFAYGACAHILKCPEYVVWGHNQPFGRPPKRLVGHVGISEYSLEGSVEYSTGPTNLLGGLPKGWLCPQTT